MSSDRLDRVLSPGYLEGLDGLELDEVRTRRSECQEVELGLSYARRLVQGRLDIIHAELERRETGGGPSGASDLVDRLKDGSILSEHTRPAGFGRLPTLMAPDEAAEEFTREIDAVADAESLADLPELDDEVVTRLAESLSVLERSLSERRKQVHERIDSLQAEIVRRYKSGSADPEQLLR